MFNIKKNRPGRLFIVCIILFFNSGFLFSQNYNWITPNKTYLKLYINNDGVYRINKSDFTNAGINTSVIDPRTIKVLNNGAQIPVYFSGEGDGVFNDNDYLDFFGTRNHGGLTETYNDDNSTAYETNEYYNLYSDTNLYYIDWNGANGIRYPANNFSTTTLYPVDFFYQKLHFEKDKFYSQGENISGSDYRYLTTEKFLGEGWYWGLLSGNESVSDTFSLPALYGTPQNSSVRIFAYPQNAEFSLSNEHSLEVRVNGNLISTLFRNNFNRFDTTVNFSSSLLSNFSVNNITVKYVCAPGFDGHLYFDLFELKCPKSFRISNKNLSADLNSADTTSRLFKISGYSPLNQLNFYDVNNNIRISNFTTSGDTLKFTGKSNARFEIVNDSVRNKPVRIKQRQVPDLVSSGNGADYLIVYNSLFQPQAEQLRAYRQSHDGFRSVKSEIEDIYDIFNYGKEDPVAVRNFVKYIYDSWQLPKLKYINLFGRGSLDPKKNSSASVYEKNYVPVYGNPPSDGYFANLNIGTFYYYDQIAVGRFPVYYNSEAQTMVNKIIAYDNEPADRWWKTFSYITGGSTFNEQQSYQQRSNFESSSYVSAPPVSGEAHKIYRTDTSGHISFNYADSIKNDINRGTLFVNFRGHAGSHDWEVGMQDPNTLNNGNKLPLILSLTCFTGENAKADFRGFGEKFAYLNGKGSIGFVGTTGWSFASSGNDFGTYILLSLKRDSTRRIGDLTKFAGLYMADDSLSFAVRHTVNCYNLIGDPAVKIIIPKIPEFVIRNNDYKLSVESITLNDPVTLTIYPKNFGLFADSCKIRFQIKKNNQNYLIKDTVYKSFRYMDSLLYNFKLDTPGVFTMTVNLDQGNYYPAEDKSNNSITFRLPYNQYAFLQLSPVDNSIIYKDSVEMTGLNPEINYSKNNVKILLQLDTTILFNSPVLKTFANNSLTGVSTKFKSPLSVTINNTVYYWRTNSIINTDSTGWSGSKRFVYGSSVSIVQDKKAGEPEEDRYINSDKRTSLYKFKSDQFSVSDFNNTGYSSDGIKLNEYPATLFVRSLGSNAEEASYFNVGDKTVYIDGGLNSGLDLLKVSRLNGSILEFKNLKMTSAVSSDSLVTFLNSFDSTHYLMLLNAAYVQGSTTLNSNAKTKLRQFGSVFCDSIGLLSYFHTWSFIGFLGAASPQVSEMFDPCCRPAPACSSCDHWTQSVSSLNVIFRKTSGTLSNIIGPAKEWTEFYWKQSVPLNSSLLFDVIGINNSGAQTLLKSNLQANKFIELTSIDARAYPKLNLLAKFNIDTVTGSQSAVLNSIIVNYSPASELVLDKNSLVISSLKREDNVINLSFNYHNAGSNFISGSIIKLYNGIISDSNVILTDTVKSVLKPDSLRNYSRSFTPPKSRDSSKLYIYIKPKDLSNEFYTFNNSASFVISTSSGSVSDLKVLFDGKEVNNGEYTRKDPEVKINLIKEKEILNEDTTLISIRLNENYVPYFINGNLNPLVKKADNDRQLKGSELSLNYYPELRAGKNELTIIYKNENDFSDTVSYDVFVSGEMSVKEFYNYPNPMRSETDFIFNLEGFAPENLFRIKIYTVSGRLIKEILHNAVTGYNQIPWDGKDNDGDVLANGTYFYKLIYDDNSNKESQAQKLVILR